MLLRVFLELDGNVILLGLRKSVDQRLMSYLRRTDSSELTSAIALLTFQTLKPKKKLKTFFLKFL